MAEFEVDYSSIDSLIRSLESADMYDDEMQKKLLNAGADVLISTIQEEGARSGFNLKRILPKVSKSRKVKKGRAGDKYLMVTVSGKNERGERNATIAFVANYGRSETYGRIHGSYFWTRAVQRSEKAIQSTYEEVITQELSERRLI